MCNDRTSVLVGRLNFQYRLRMGRGALTFVMALGPEDSQKSRHRFGGRQICL
jgi:hypothetical protein